MRLAQIEHGFVVNVIVVDPANVPDWCSGWPVCEDAGPGWQYQGGKFLPPFSEETEDG